MQTTCWEMPWVRALRVVALILTAVLGLEWTGPYRGYAQPNQEPATTPAASVENQESPPMQEAAVTEEPTPFYKKWWFWTLLVVVAAGVFIGVVVNEAVNDGVYVGPGPG